MELRAGAALLVALLGCLLAGPAAADARDHYIWQELSLRFTDLGKARASETSTGLGTVHTSSQASNHLSTLSLPVQSLVTTVPVTDPGQAPITEVRFDLRRSGGAIGNISGAIADASWPGLLTPATLPMTGGVTICLLSQYPDCVVQRLILPLGATSGGLPVGDGVGGLLTIGGTATIRISIVGAPYTVRTVSAIVRTEGGGLDVETARGFAHGPASSTSSTALTSGVLQIVTSSRITAVGPGATDLSSTISRTLIHIMAPEPGLGLLLGSGAVALALLGRRRRAAIRRRRP